MAQKEVGMQRNAKAVTFRGTDAALYDRQRLTLETRPVLDLAEAKYDEALPARLPGLQFE